MNFQKLIEDTFGVKVYNYPKTTITARQCSQAYLGVPRWADGDEIRTVNFAKAIASEVARLVMLGTSIKFAGSRAEYMQKVIDARYFDFRTWAEYANAYGTIVIKPNGEDYDCLLPWEFYVTEIHNGQIVGAVFIAQQKVEDEWFTRLEYHRFTGTNGETGRREYTVSNRCFVGKTKTSIDRSVEINNTPWSTLADDVTMQVERPLFAVLRTPQANRYSPECPLGLPIYSDALEELEDLDIAYNRMTEEIADSRRIVMIDADRLMLDGGSLKNAASRIGKLDAARRNMGLPKYVKAINEDADGTPIYKEINPELNTEMRLKGINHLLSQIGYKVGFANGYFVFNEASGIQTATGVEANEQRTIQFIKDCRDRMENALDDLIYAISAFADLYDLAPAGDYEVNYQFGDITYNEDEDRTRWLSYANSGKVPFWYYLVKFEGMTKEDAIALTDAAKLRTDAYPIAEE